MTEATKVQSTVRTTPVEDLPLPDRLKLADTINPYANLKAGHYIDARDTVSNWCVAEVLKIDSSEVKVSYDGWSPSYDDVMRLRSYKLSPFRLASRGYTGQAKIPLRRMDFSLEQLGDHRKKLDEVISSEFRCLTTAFEVTQYLRGKLFVYTHFLMANEFKDPDKEIPEVINFLKQVVKLIALWLKKFPSYLKSFSEVQSHPKLMLVDRNAALAACGYELLDILQWLFCLGPQTTIFFERYDVDVEANDGAYVRLKEGKFAGKRNKAPSVVYVISKLELEKEMLYGLFVNLFNEFCVAGGLDEILKTVLNGHDGRTLPLDFIIIFIAPLKSIRPIASKEVCGRVVETIKKMLQQRVEKLDDKDIKDLSKSTTMNFMALMKRILKSLCSEEAKVVKKYEMLLSVKFLQSASLEKRLNGLADIRKLIERCKVVHRPFCPPAAIKKVSDADELAKWIIEQKILEFIYNENAHAEMIKRSSHILIFLASQNSLTNDILDLMWNCKKNKHEDIILAVHFVINECVRHLTINHLVYIMEKIKQVPLDKYDDKFLTFMKEFTVQAYETHESEGYSDIKSLEELEAEVSRPKTEPSDSLLFCVPIFWSLLQDETPVSLELTELANSEYKVCVSRLPSVKCKLQYLWLCMENLKNNKAVPQSLDNALYILQLLNNKKVLKQNVILKLFKHYKVIESILESFRVYFEKMLKRLRSIGRIEEEKVGTKVFAGKYNHTININKRLQFLCEMEEYAPKECKTTTRDVQALWDMFMEDTHPKYDVELLLQRFTSEHESSGKIIIATIFELEQTVRLFELLCRERQRLSKDHGLTYFKCLTNNFRLVNILKGFIEAKKNSVKTSDIARLVGLDTVWDYVTYCSSEKIRESLNDFLINLYTNLADTLLEKYMEVLSMFIARCMNIIIKADPLEDELVITNMVKLLLSFFHSIDGAKFKVQDEIDSRYYTQSITVVLQPRGVAAKLEVGLDISVGELRKKIADEFGVPFSGFTMSSKTITYERDYDNSLLRDIGWNKQITVKCFLDAEGNPKLLISNDRKCINRLFLLLSKESASYVEPVWELLMTLPRNEKMVADIKGITTSSSTVNDWNPLLDTQSIHKFLYVLQIIEGIITPPAETHFASVDAEVFYKRWMVFFCKREGLKHLFCAFINLPINSLHHPLTRKCFGMLLKVLELIQEAGFPLSEHVANFEEHYQSLIQRVLIVLEAFAQFSILSEKEKHQRMLKLQKSPKHNEESTNKEIAAMEKQLKEQVEESKVFDYAFKIIRQGHKDYFDEMARSPLFRGLLLKGLVLSDNRELRKVFASKLLRVCRAKEVTSRPHAVLVPHMLQMVKETFSQTGNSQEFYSLLVEVIKLISKEMFDEMKVKVHDLLEATARHIRERPVIERTSKDTDHVLIGLFSLLECLLGKFPCEQVFVGQSCGVLNEVLRKCLFEFPVMAEQSLGTPPPKCKSDESRVAAFRLLQALSKDCPTNLSQTLAFLTPIHAKGAWRTRRSQDWSIMGESTEKSTAGYVGLKNLGCICYMNSLLQQFYMIPSFRNAVLSIEDVKRNAVLEEDLLYQTQYLFAELHESVKQFYDPKVFCHAFKDWDNKSINVLEQMDVDEFFNLFLDKLEALTKGTLKEKAIKRHFGGVFANQLLCKDCPHSRELEEPFLALNLQVKNKKSLQKCLENFVEGEMLQGDNAYNCEKCDKKVTTLKRVCIKRLPRYLIFVLKRFDINYDTMQKFKINDYCEFPPVLNMEAFTAEGLAKKDQEKMRDEARKEGKDLDELPNAQQRDLPQYPAEYYEYRLSGIIIHMGTADTGHYYSLIKDREKVSVPESKRWFEFNDTIVEQYDPEEIKDDAFGGEEKMQRFDGVMFRSMEKSRNAYLLVYDRVGTYEPPEENEAEETTGKEVAESCETALKIPERIHSEIMQENIKHWYGLYMFHDRYFEFAVRLCMNWNTTENILDTYPCRNNDFEVFGLPKEDFLRCAFAEPKDKLPIGNSSSDKAVEAEVFKYLVTLVLTTLFRLKFKSNISEFMNLMKAHMNKNRESAVWLLWQFSSPKVVQEFLLECHEADIRRLVVGLLYCAMLKVYREEKSRLHTSAHSDILVNFLNAMLRQLPLCHKYAGNFEQFFQVFSRLATLGPEMRSYFWKTKLLKRLLSFLCNPKEVSESANEDVPYRENTNPELGVSSEVDERFQSPLEKYLNADRQRQGTQVSYCFLAETVALLLRSVTFEDTPVSPLALPECKNAIDPDAKKLLNRENLIEVIDSLMPNISATAFAKACKHLSWECPNFKGLLLDCITTAIRTNETRKVLGSVYLFGELISLVDGKQETFVPLAMAEFNKMMKAGQWANPVILYLMDHMLEFAKSVPLANEWYCKNVEQWKWVFEWLKRSKGLASW